MYKYFENTCTNQTVYLCKDGIEEFRKDVEALGLVTCLCQDVHGFFWCLAIDPLEDGKHKERLETVRKGLETETEFDPGIRKDGPFPKERTFRICTVWEMWGASRVTTKTLQEAIDQVILHDSLPEGYYVDESQKLDEEADFTEAWT